MAALIKKRALAEYCYSVTEEGPRPAKRLQIVKRSRGAEQWDFNLNTLDSTVSPKELLQSLISLQQSLPPPNENRGEILHKLLDLLQEISDQSKGDETSKKHNPLYSTIISKLLSLIPEIISSSSTPIGDIQQIIEKMIAVASHSTSSKNTAHAVQAAYSVIKGRIGLRIFEQFLQLLLKLLTTPSTSYLIKVRCLEAAGGLCPSEASKTQSAIIESLVLHTVDQDNRVRTASFTALLEVKEQRIDLPPELYENACSALRDDYQCVRESALSLIKVLAEKDPERMVPVPGCDQHIRLVDHAFSQICNAINDISVRVRTLAASLLGSFKGLSDHFLQQTLDKKIMSNMRRKISAHERARVLVSAGEWSSGKRWGEDRPQEQMTEDEAQVISSGSCGAFVHGLEDEFLEVRNASLDSISTLASNNPSFANQCLDFLVDMFNDEIEDVRLKAIQVVQAISHQIKLRPDQLDEILHALKDSWLDIRESLHSLLGICRLTTTTCVTASLNALLDNLRRYPQDKRSIHRCLKQMGSNHPELVLALVPQFLRIHPYFDGVEPSVQDGDYIAKLILVFNAAAHCPTILSLLEEHTLRHHAYLRDTMPQLVPQLKIDEQPLVNESLKTNTVNFLKESIEAIAKLEQSKTPLRHNIYSAIHSDFTKLADLDPNLSAAANMGAIYVECMHLLTKVFSTRNWLTPSSLSSQQSGSLKTSVDLLLRNTLKLRYIFHGMTPAEKAAIRALRVRTLAFQLVYIFHGSTGSTLGLCDNFLEHVEGLNKELQSKDLQPDAFIESLIRELSQLEEPRPAAVARIIQPLLLEHGVPPLSPFANPSALKMCWAEILEPSSDSEVVYKLSAGLVVGVSLDAEIWHLNDLSALRIRVTYPDHTNHHIIPSRSDLRAGEAGCHRLLTTVLISAQVWSESCHVGISLVLDLSDQEALAGRKHLALKADEGATNVSLCQPVKVLVWPKQIRKGI